MADSFTNDPVGQLRSIGGDARELASEVQEAASEVADLVRGELDVHPYRTLGIAALTGYVLGGGLASPLTGQFVRLGLRLALIPFLQSQIAQRPTGQTAGATQH